MALEFKLPDVGEGIAEGEIVKWLVKVGDVVKEHQSIVEVMTDKATVEVPSPAAGKITALKAKEGDTVPVGSVIFVLDTAAGGAAAAAAPAPAAPKAAPTPAPVKAAPAPAPIPAKAAPAPAAPVASGATLDFKLPDIGEGIAEGEIVKWLVKQGDFVKEHQSVVEVMTDKATVEVPSPASGTITKLHVKDGQTVPVGTVLFSLATAGAASAKPAAAPAAAATAPARTPAMAMAAAPAAPARASDEKVLAAPSARRVARELGIDLHSVAGSGRNGVVRRADVEAFAQNGAARTASSAPAAAAAPARPQYAPISLAPGERETRIPFRGVRRKIAEAMVRSKFTAPHFTVVEEVDITQLVALKDQAKAMHAASGVKITFMPFIMKATAMALAQHPMLNAHLDEGSQEIVRYGYVNLGIAMDTDNGLIVPVVKNVDSKSILQIAAELAELAERTRAGKVKADELKGSTFSITNAGNIGGTLATPIINYPDVAILGVHRIMKKPGVVETSMGDRIEVRQYMNFSCSVDHRLADGADGARFLVLLKKILENPGLLAL